MKEGLNYSVEQLPRSLPLYFKALRRRPRFAEGDLIPATRVHWPGLEFDQEPIVKYARVCQVPLHRGHAPLLFPHALFGPLHLLMLTDARFPLSVLGGLHVRNHVLQHLPLFPGDVCDATLQFSAQRRRPQGLEVDLRTEISAGERLMWESVTTFLFRQRFSGEDPESPHAASVPNIAEPQFLNAFAVPAGTGRAYGRVSRDLNPIHLSRWLARAFGFERDLCHGMWALSRGISMVEGIDFWEPVRCDALFKGPLYIGRDITVKTSPADAGHFELYSGDNARPCVVGAVRNVAAGSRLEG